MRGCHDGGGGGEERGENEEEEREESVDVHLKRALKLLGGCSDLKCLESIELVETRSVCCWFVVIVVRGGRGCVEGESYSSCVEK